MEGEADEHSKDETRPGSTRRKFQLPKRLRGWLFLERAHPPLKEHSVILNMTGGVNIDKLKKVMMESYPEKSSQGHGRTDSNQSTMATTKSKEPIPQTNEPTEQNVRRNRR